MKASELRVGNLVWHKGDTKVVDGITFRNDRKGHFIGISNHGTWELEDEFSPVPLTEEWLLKFGFEKEELSQFDLDNEPDVWYFKNNARASFGLCNEGSYWTFYTGAKAIKFVHEIQNLFHSITGEELKEASTASTTLQENQ